MAEEYENNIDNFELLDDSLFEIDTEEEAAIMDVMMKAFHCNP